MIGILNSWKEIASYLGRGVRTVQRWERDLGLPVRRPHGRKRSTVMALVREIDAWLLRTDTLADDKDDAVPIGQPLSGTPASSPKKNLCE
jgi:hypothetical protein